MIDTGQAAPDFRLELMGQGFRTLDELLADGPVLLAFYKVTCPTCQFTLPFLDRLQGGSFRVFAISQDDAARSTEFADAFETRLPQLLDRAEEGYPASNAYGIAHVPSMFLIRQDKQVTWTWVGFHRKQLESLAAMAGRPIFTPADIVPEAKSG